MCTLVPYAFAKHIHVHFHLYGFQFFIGVDYVIECSHKLLSYLFYLISNKFVGIDIFAFHPSISYSVDNVCCICRTSCNDDRLTNNASLAPSVGAC